MTQALLSGLSAFSNSSSQRQSRAGSLNPSLLAVLERVREEIGYSEDQGELSAEELRNYVLSAAASLALELTEYELDEVQAHVEQDAKVFGPLQKLVDDETVSDIIVSNYAKVSVQRGRANYSTSVRFSSKKSYENFVERLLQRAGSSYSTKRPVADGMIGDFARIHVVHSALCESGPYLTIRLNRFGKVSTSDLIRFGTAPEEIFRYLSAMVAAGNTLLLVGEVGTGKTTLARALAGTISAEDSILVIEDTPEIRLEHPHVRYLTTRAENLDGEGRISPSECIRAGMRMAMNRIIFGEMRDAEAAEAFIDVCASGHPGLSTIHARSAGEAIARLELFLGRAQRGTSKEVLNAQIAQAVQVIVFVGLCEKTRKRRIMEVVEITGAADGVVRQREMFRYKKDSEIPEWTVTSRSSAFDEELKKQGFEPDFANSVTLSDELLYLEATRANR